LFFITAYTFSVNLVRTGPMIRMDGLPSLKLSLKKGIAGCAKIQAHALAGL
jgi:hypothetical protein